MLTQTPSINIFKTHYKDRSYQLEYFIRKGTKETILFIHGLGGAKENFWEALKSEALKNYTLICFDNPGTGNSTYYENDPLDLDDLVNLTTAFIDGLKLDRFILAGASMGGLITLIYLNEHTQKKVIAYINIEGNLMPEDCMFSSKVVQYELQEFRAKIFQKAIQEMKQHGNAGYYIISNNLQLNTNATSYYHYSFPTVAYSSSGDLLSKFIALSMPKLFIYGEANGHLSYLSLLEASNIKVAMIRGSDHFVFYDNPKEMYEEITAFIELLQDNINVLERYNTSKSS
jgi:pimeloyl-ACP methyl ester carboxylesterase